MKVEVAYTTPSRQFAQSVELAEGATLADAIERCGVLKLFPTIDLDGQKVGVHGKIKPLTAALGEGDRVEIYRPITADPETVPRRDLGDDG